MDKKYTFFQTILLTKYFITEHLEIKQFHWKKCLHSPLLVHVEILTVTAYMSHILYAYTVGILEQEYNPIFFMFSWV